MVKVCKWIIFPLLITLIFSSFVTSEDKIDFTIKLVDGNNAELNALNIIEPSTNLMLKVTATNPTNKWVFIKDLWPTIECKHNGEPIQCYKKQSSSGEWTVPITLPPTNKDYIYLPLTGYNLLPEDNRIGSWQILFTAPLYQYSNIIVCYEKDSLKESSYCNVKGGVANPLEFKVAKKDVVLPTTPSDNKGFNIKPPSSGWDYVWWILGSIFIIIAGYILTGKRKKR